jgi:hypothetical protein
MVNINDMLQKAGIHLNQTYFLRHANGNALAGCSPIQLWRANDGRLERYQAVQSRTSLANATWLVSFVATELRETLFVGVWEKTGVGIAPQGETDPVTGADCSGSQLLELAPHNALKDYHGRIVVDWGRATQSFAQRGTILEPIIEIRRRAMDPPFPGVLIFQERLNALKTVPASWQEVLSEAKGVYALVCTECGKPYVGSACGAQGLWGRWLTYYANGHGGNIGMKRHSHKDYNVCVLEVFGSSITGPEMIQREELWKRKLQTVKFGLNENATHLRPTNGILGQDGDSFS